MNKNKIGPLAPDTIGGCKGGGGTITMSKSGNQRNKANS